MKVFSLQPMITSYNILSYLKWRCHARTKQGHSVHSPFLYALISNSLHKTMPAEKVAVVEQYRKKLLSDKSLVVVTDLGSGSSLGNGAERRVCDMARHCSMSARDGRLLYNLACSMNCRNFIELGTNLGIGTLYLSSVDSCERIITIEGCPNLSEMARRQFDTLHINKINCVNAEFSEVLQKSLGSLPSVDFVYFDGNHQYGPTLTYFELCLPFVHNDTVFVFDDIHKNAEMEKAWKKLSTNQKVTLSLDFYTMGVLFFRRQLSRQTISLRY